MIRRILLAIAMLGTVTIPMPAAAAPGFAATITAVTPALPVPGDTITLTADLRNPSTADITDITARFIVSTDPLRGRSEIPLIVSGELLPTYRIVEAGSASGIDLAAGAGASVTLRATTRELGLPADRAGVYVIGVQLDGTTAGRGVVERRTSLLPWMPYSTKHNLGVLTVWTITAPPALGADGILIDDSLPTALAADGRLRRQLDAMRSTTGAIWLIDPLLVDAVQAIADGAAIHESQDVTRAASDAQRSDADAWLNDLRFAVATGTVAALPLGDLDVRAAMKFGRISVARTALASAADRLSSALGIEVNALDVPLYAGAVTTSTWKFLRSSGATLGIVSDEWYAPTQTQYTPSTGLKISAFASPVVVVDHTTSSTPALPDTPEAQSRQAFAAQLLMTMLERPNDDRVITIAVPPTWTPSAEGNAAEVLRAPWIDTVGIAGAIAAGTSDRIEQNAVATTRQRSQDLRLGRAVEQQRQLMHITSDPTFSSSIADAVIGTMSRWYTGRTGTDHYSSATVARLTAYAQAVRVVTRGDIVFGGERGVVPVTIANGLPVPVDIVLRASGIPSVRIEPTPTTSLHLNAGKRVSVEVSTRVTGSGDALLALEIVTNDQTLIDGPTFLSVRSAAYARVAQYLVIVAFIALLFLVGFNVVRRIRDHGSLEADE